MAARVGALAQADRQAALAQLVEHIIRNDGVVGSSPPSGTTSVAALPVWARPKQRHH